MDQPANNEGMADYFNWVQARSQCSVKEAFLLLAETVDSDVKERQKLAGGDHFRLERQKEKLIVLRNGNAPVASIVFELKAARIDIRQGSEPFFSVSPWVSSAGKCRLVRRDSIEALEFWQVSRMALEHLFFGEES